ncbi:MAG TPA: phosphatidate cytidylyltransferase [Gammaproteobacteria bacterium]|nr:phosphatidate cytidylyltransferase [Gammaproteobacteria bacterium]
MLRTRILAAAVMLPAAVVWVWLAPFWLFSAIAALILLAAAWEWSALAGLRQAPQRLAYLAGLLVLMALCWWGIQSSYSFLPLFGFFSAFWLFVLFTLGRAGLWNSCVIFLLQGVMVLVPAFLALLVLKRIHGGTSLVFTLFAVVWSADIGAYFAGRAAGRHKLSPRVSPGKTWEGFLGGVVLAAIAGAIASPWSPASIYLLVPLAVITAAVSVVGDLAESQLKRFAGAKDSGRLIPGHGGILDRIDSLCAALPVFVLGIELGQKLW